MKTWLRYSFVLSVSAATSMASAGFEDSLKGAFERFGGAELLQKQAVNHLSDSDMVDGLKEALANGVESAIHHLGRQDGFLQNELVRIAVPDSVRSVEVMARKLGQGRYVDQFVASMNHAAEDAVPDASKILGDAIRDMSVKEAAEIIQGADDAATQYFQRVTAEKLKSQFLPLVKQATDKAGVTSAYKGVVSQGGQLFNQFAGGMGLLGIGEEIGRGLDLDEYVTEQALQGLFTYIALEEKRIRDNPAARTTALLQKVFGQ